MSEEAKGRNILDVAMELTNRQIDTFGVSDFEEIKQIYTECYSLAKALGEKSGLGLHDFLPEEIKKHLL